MRQDTGRTRRCWRCPACLFSTVWGVALVLLIAGGCGKTVVDRPTPAPPPPTFTGPAFLHGTVGSMCQLRGFTPQLVSAYGLVVKLNNTGSSEVPAFLRSWMINEMRRMGVGSARLGYESMSPEAILADPSTALVTVQGLIPAGATKGTPFDVLVTALPGTQTTSLQGGTLWTAQLAIDGANPSIAFRRPLAMARGPMYLDPFSDDPTKVPSVERNRRAVILGGGVVTEDQPLELVLNQPSYTRARLIADRINERFGKAPSDHRDTAEAQSPSLIRINVPARFSRRPGQLAQLIGHLYVQQAEGFEVEQARRLGDVLSADPVYAPDVTLAWQTLGKTALDVMRQYYRSPNIPARLAALEAGASLNDHTVVDPVAVLALESDPALRRAAAMVLRYLPDSERGGRVLRQLLDDPDRSVRIAAYESVAAAGDPLVARMQIGQGEDFKFILELIPSKQPLIYVRQTDVPRLVIFSPDAGFNLPLLARVLDDRMMLRDIDDKGRPMVSIFYQKPGQTEGQVLKIAPAVANLALVMGREPTSDNDGMNLSYSQVVNTLHALRQKGALVPDIEFQLSPLVQAIAKAQEQTASPVRPELGSPVTQPAPDNAANNDQSPPATR